jgi:nucleoside-diphosphate-sugar epimerase
VAPARVLVTGGAGFLGRHLVRALAGEAEVVSADLAAPAGGSAPAAAGDPGVPRRPAPRVTEVACDVRDGAAVAALVGEARPATVFHLAAVLALPAEADPVLACRVNVEGTLHVLEAARRAGVGRVVLASSVAVYGSTTGRLTEDAPLRPVLAYGATKVAAEALGAYVAARHGLDVRALRLPSLLGPGRGAESLTGNYSRLVVAAAAGEPFVAPLPPETCLPLAWVGDAVRALRALAAAPAARLGRAAYHVAGFAPPLSLGALADAVRRRRPGAALAFRPDPAVAARVGPLATLDLDDAAARADWGWAPRRDVDGMVAEFLAALAAPAAG